tara:strand:- start:261 stop:530 length:270 start_codon:yes stop_codon:yes gene_type:complete
MEERLTNMEKQLEGMKSLMIKLNNNIEKINNKIDIITESIDEDLITECKKMGSHIDFIENVYETVKKPLNYVCDKINILKDEKRSITNS